jgi:molybdate transport system ATP-binding protein
LDQGKTCQTGPIHQVFMQPADAAVARIVGVETIEPARIIEVADGLATLAIGPVRLTALASGALPGDAYVCIRAEEVILEKGDIAPTSARNRLTGQVRALTPEGPMVRVSLDCGFRLMALVTNQACRELELAEGDRVTALIKAPAIHLVPRG